MRTVHVHLAGLSGFFLSIFPFSAAPCIALECLAPNLSSQSKDWPFCFCFFSKKLSMNQKADQKNFSFFFCAIFNWTRKINKRKPQDIDSKRVDVQCHLAPGLSSPRRLQDSSAGCEREAHFGFDEWRSTEQEFRLRRRRPNSLVLSGSTSKRSRMPRLHHPSHQTSFWMGQKLHVLELRWRWYYST